MSHITENCTRVAAAPVGEGSTPARATLRRLRPGRRGQAVIYTIIVLPVLIGITSFAVDLGRVQVAKSDMQAMADSTARGYLAMRLAKGDSYAQSHGGKIPSGNPSGINEGPAPTVNITRGYLDTSNNFVESSGVPNGRPFAVRVRVSRTAAAGNPVRLPWRSVLGIGTTDISVLAVAVLTNKVETDHKVSAQSDPWLAGMPPGSKASYNDYAGTKPNSDKPSERLQSPKQMMIPVVPGSYITFGKIKGEVRHGPTLEDYEPDGKSSIYSHGADSPGGPTPAAENGIGDVKMPINAFMGVFLDDKRPDSTPAPTVRRDYTSSSSRSKEYYEDIQRKQPFFIGDGKTGTGSGKDQKFRVPDGATRLFVGIMDGHEWSNNVGEYVVTTTVLERIELVR